MTNTLNKIMHNGTEYDFPEWFTPDNAWNTDDVLKKTANGYEWATPSGWDVVWPASSTDWHLAVFDWATGKLIKDWGVVPTGDVKYSDFEIATATSWATLTISDLTTEFVPTVDFTMSAWTVKEWMQYIVRLDSWATAYTLTLGTGITNPFWEDLTLTASKMTTVVLFATSSSALEVFSVRTAS